MAKQLSDDIPIIENKFNWKMQETSFLHRASTAICNIYLNYVNSNFTRTKTFIPEVAERLGIVSKFRF